MFSLLLLVVVATFFAEIKQNEAGQIDVLVYTQCDSESGEPLDCQDRLSRDGTLRDGYYQSCPRVSYFEWAVHTQCDMNGGGWTIVLKRFDGSIDFNQTWDKMKHRVGHIDGEYWLGLEDVRRFTTSGDYSMMVEIREGPHTWTEVYDSFTLSGEAENYKLRVEGFDSTNSNNADAALGRHNDLPFSTHDRDNTGHPDIGECTSALEGPHWFNSACRSDINPFGPYPQSDSDGSPKMQWRVNGRDINPTELIWKIKRRGP